MVAESERNAVKEQEGEQRRNRDLFTTYASAEPLHYANAPLTTADEERRGQRETAAAANVVLSPSFEIRSTPSSVTRSLSNLRMRSLLSVGTLSFRMRRPHI